MLGRRGENGSDGSGSMEGELGRSGSTSVVELQRVNKIRRDFVANVSHELKSETERFAKLITDLLDLASLESEEEVQNPQPVDLRSILMVVLARLRPAARQKNISLSWKRFGKAATYTVYGNETQLTSMFSNLVENAVKYTPPGGRVEVSASSDENEIVVVVSDSGIGIPEEGLSRIFERFYRVDKARSKETGGTGLGLSIVRHVAENHGGRVGVESALGEGTTFSVHLPRG